MNKTIKTSINIQAPVETVWQILMDFKKYPEWNPFIRSIKGNARKGEVLENTLVMEGTKAQVFRPQIIALKSQQEFRWLGHLWIKGLFDGEHYFLLKSIGAGHTQLVHGENFSGFFSKPILKMIKSKTQAGFEAMNNALKKQAEEMV
ncbi:SRPBCC domain-containing protein [Rapidithrix thailandica]|uniref:SRPBCC domain-containing protein n=1 Tax=Rapidithrix thailandica TaxID=413964 RepID=A0AAW9RQF9_9BACT